MPAIEKTEMTTEYRDMRRSAAVRGETNDCSVVAVAMVCGVSYDEAHAALTSRGRKHRSGAQIYQIREACNLLGFDCFSATSADFIQRYPKPHSDVLRSITSHHPRRFNKVWKDGNRYLLFTSGHVLACIDGTVHDWSSNKALRVTSLCRVVERKK